MRGEKAREAERTEVSEAQDPPEHVAIDRRIWNDEESA